MWLGVEFHIIMCLLWSELIYQYIFALFQIFISWWFLIGFIVKCVNLVSIVWSKRSLTSRLTCTQEGAYGEPITGPYCAWRHMSINSRARWLGVAQYLVDRSTCMCVSGKLCRSVVGCKIKFNKLKTRCWLNQTSLILIKIIFLHIYLKDLLLWLNIVGYLLE